MKKVNLIIVIFLLTIGFTAETLGQSSLPTTTTIEVQTQKIESIRIIDAESNAFNEVVSGYNVNTNKRFLSINKENISHILSDENDIENSDHSCSYVSIEDNLLSVAGVVNSTSKLGMNTDIQSRIVIWDTNSKTKLHSFTFRNLESWRYLADQQLYKDKYLFLGFLILKTAFAQESSLPCYLQLGLLRK